jgi:branched-chain amino acid transport system ATP-binding protein
MDPGAALLHSGGGVPSSRSLVLQDLTRPIRALQQETGMSILPVEQNVREALKISDRVAVMKSGAIIHEARPDELADNARLMELY